MDLSNYNNSGFDRGASAFKEALWVVCRRIWFRNALFRGYRWRRFLLRAFGARVGRGVIVKPGVHIAMPWRLTLGDRVWLGEETHLLNLAPISIGADTCISQRAFLCTGNHDWSDPAFRLRTAPIVIESGVWVCACAFIGPGVTLARNCVVTAGSVVSDSMPAQTICSGNPCVPVKPRAMRQS